MVRSLLLLCIVSALRQLEFPACCVGWLNLLNTFLEGLNLGLALKILQGALKSRMDAQHVYCYHSCDFGSGVN